MCCSPPFTIPSASRLSIGAPECTRNHRASFVEFFFANHLPRQNRERCPALAGVLRRPGERSAGAKSGAGQAGGCIRCVARQLGRSDTVLGGGGLRATGRPASLVAWTSLGTSCFAGVGKWFLSRARARGTAADGP